MRIKDRLFHGFLFSLLCAFAVAAQTPTVVTGTITDSNGTPYSNASIQAQLIPSTASPTIIINGIPTAIGGQQNANADANGVFSMNLFCNSAGGGCSVISPSGTQWQFTVNTTGAPLPIGTGPQTCTATLTITGASQSITASFSACPKLSNITAAAGCTPAGAQGAVQIKNGAACAAGGATDISGQFSVSDIFNTLADAHAKGPNPSIDVTLYGARAVNIGAAPAIPGITANCVNGSPSVPISAASAFVNGDGVDVFGCGAPHAMATPAAPSVTPSIAAAMTNTGYVVPAPSGAITKCYVIAARDQAQGLTAASPETCTTTGNTLGNRSVNITSLSRNATSNVVTVTTSTAHGLTIGCSNTLATCPMVYIQGTTNETNFGGWFIVTGVSDNTHFTYAGGLDARFGAATSATGGTVTWWNCNHLVLPAFGAGMWQYIIYAGNSGAETFAGISLPNVATSPLYNDGTGPLVWDDFGYPAPQQPYFVPNAPPALATSDSLVTTISSGAGGTNLTLANAAGTTINGQTILLDSGPGITAANAAAIASPGAGGMIYFPVQKAQAAITVNFVVNSLTTITNATAIGVQAIGVSQAAAITLNDTIVCQSCIWSGSLTVSGAYMSAPSFVPVARIPLTARRAYPGLAVDGGEWTGLEIDAFSDSNLGMFYSSGGNSLFTDMIFHGGGTHSTAFYDYAPSGGSFGYKMRNVSFVGDGGANGTISVPISISKANGQMAFDYVTMGNRGMFWTSASAGFNLEWVMGEEQQGANMPMHTFYSNSHQYGGNTGGHIILRALENDTGAHAFAANLGTTSSALGESIEIDGSNLPTSGETMITGWGFITARIRVDSSCATVGQSYSLICEPNLLPADGQPIIDQNNRYTLYSGTTSGIGAGSISGPTAAPIVTITTSGCGGQFPSAGTHNYVYGWVDGTATNFGNGQVNRRGLTTGSPATPATVDGTTQCVLVSYTSVPPPGAAAWVVYRDSAITCPGNNYPLTQLTFLDTRPTTCGNPALPTTSTAAKNVFEALNIAGSFVGDTTTSTEFTAGQCFSAASPAVCGTLIDGTVAIAAGASSVVVNSSQVTANSNIQLTFDATKGTQLSITCNTTAQQPYVSAIVAGTSFTISVPAAFAVNPGCINYHYKN